MLKDSARYVTREVAGMSGLSRIRATVESQKNFLSSDWRGDVVAVRALRLEPIARNTNGRYFRALCPALELASDELRCGCNPYALDPVAINYRCVSRVLYDWTRAAR